MLFLSDVATHPLMLCVPSVHSRLEILRDCVNTPQPEQPERDDLSRMCSRAM